MKLDSAARMIVADGVPAGLDVIAVRCEIKRVVVLGGPGLSGIVDGVAKNFDVRAALHFHARGYAVAVGARDVVGHQAPVRHTHQADALMISTQPEPGDGPVTKRSALDVRRAQAVIRSILNADGRVRSRIGRQSFRAAGGAGAVNFQTSVEVIYGRLFDAIHDVDNVSRPYRPDGLGDAFPR